jgi:hypothetical protein
MDESFEEVGQPMAKRMTRKTASGTPAASPLATDSVAYESVPASVADQAADNSRPANRIEDPLTDATRNDSMGSEPSEEEIRIRAYRRYLERGRSHGQDFDDWLAAERELKHTR